MEPFSRPAKTIPLAMVTEFTAEPVEWVAINSGEDGSEKSTTVTPASPSATARSPLEYASFLTSPGVLMEESMEGWVPDPTSKQSTPSNLFPRNTKLSSAMMRLE